MDHLTQSYLAHYKIQVGGNLPVYAGAVRFQRGSGWFSRLLGGIGNFIRGIGPSLAKRALPSAIGLAQDVVAGENVGHSALNRLKEAGKNVADETLDQLKLKLQQGKGIPRNYSKKGIFKRKLCDKKLSSKTKNKPKKKRKY